MAQRNSGRIDRFAQMSKQEEIIAKKRQEILEKQRTAQLAKAVAAAQNLAAKLKEDENTKNDKNFEDICANSSAGNSEDNHDSDDKSKPKCEESSETIKTTGFGAKTGKITFGQKRNQQPAPVIEQPPVKIQNSFCNDGSFLENFKKILEKHEQQTKLAINLQTPIVAAENQIEVVKTTGSDAISTDTTQNSTGSQVTPLVTSTSQQNASFAFNPNLMAQGLILPQQTTTADQAVSGTTLANFGAQMPVPPPPPQHGIASFFNPTVTTAATSVATAMMIPDPLMSMHALGRVAPPPPPPPPQLPLALANLAPLYMIPAPEPMQLNAIPAPKEFDLNAIPKPQLNLEAIKVPTNEQQQQLQQQQEQQQQMQLQFQHEQNQKQISANQNNSIDEQQESQDKCVQLPTTVDKLIEMVSDYGDEYEENIRAHKSELHPALWFLFDKNCEQYNQYQLRLTEERHRRQHTNNLSDVNVMSAGATTAATTTTTSLPTTSSPTPLSLATNAPDSTPATSKPIEAALPGSSVADGDKYDPESVISGDLDSDDEYMRGMMDRNRDNIKRRIECRNELSEEERQEREAEEEENERRRQERKKLRKSRWGEKVKSADDAITANPFASLGSQNRPLLTSITRSDPALLQYARQNYGSTNLSEEDWKKCEEHYKVNLLYQDMIRKRQEIDRLARSGKFKYEYDSDEDVDGGTWEHKLRCAEMEATRMWAQALTKQSEGKHHIGDFLPPEELKKFMEQYEAKKNNRQPDLSDYKEFKLKEDNIGFKMLQKLGWKEGQGLGTDGAGIVEPVNKGPQREGNQGLGVANASTPENCDNEYDAYRKRMMLAYRFRPNPLNNPRRAYY